MTKDVFLDAIASDGRTLVRAAASNWSRPVPHCPDWNAAGLVRHTGIILAWMSRVLETGERIRFRDLSPSPDGDAELSAWFLANLRHTLNVMREREPDKPVWTFSSLGDHRTSWWLRRLAVEMAIHRWDAEYAVTVSGGRAPAPLEVPVAMAGIDEFVSEFLPGLLAQATSGRPSGMLRLTSTDIATDKRLDLDHQGREVRSHAEPDATVRGTASSVLLWLTNRDADAVMAGDHGLIDSWKALTR